MIGLMVFGLFITCWPCRLSVVAKVCDQNTPIPETASNLGRLAQGKYKKTHFEAKILLILMIVTLQMGIFSVP